MSRMTKRKTRILRQEGILDENSNFNNRNFAVRQDIDMITPAQKDAKEAWEDGYHLFLHGFPGTGKTFLALYFALEEVMRDKSPYKKVYIVRSVVPSRDMGFLPGTQKEKIAVYEGAYIDIAKKLFGRGDAYEILKQKNYIEFVSTSFLRGLTFDECILIVDECQNMAANELHTVMTRVGEDCKIIFSGDVKQDDLTSERKKELSGLRDFMKIIQNMKEFDFIEFLAEDIVRSDLVKNYIIQRDRLGL